MKATVKELKTQGIKCDLVANEKPRAFYAEQTGMNQPMPWVLKLHDSRFDVGFAYDSKLKGFLPRTDLWGGYVAGILGAKARAGEKPEMAALGKLNQLYGIHATTRRYIKQGYSVQRTTKADGTLALTVTGFK